MRYVNNKTGRIIETYGAISGDNYQELKEAPDNQPDINPDEADDQKPVAIEAVEAVKDDTAKKKDTTKKKVSRKTTVTKK